MKDETIEAYGFTDAKGDFVSVPAAKVTPAAQYANEPMDRAKAQDIMIAFGLSTGCSVPIRCRPNGAGFDAVLPMEAIAALPGVSRLLDQ